MSVEGSQSFSRLHFECVGGAAGDMILGALLDLGADVAAVRRALASMALPGLELRTERVVVDDIAALYVRSLVDDGAHHRNLGDVLAIIDRGDMNDAARQRAHGIFEILVAAEAVAHECAAEDVHLHEVGALDSIMDVVGIAVALGSLGNPPASASPIPSGHGNVSTAHGLLTCPVPAVAAVAERWHVPLIDVDVQGETVTPTGIAALANICSSFGDAPVIDSETDACGVGAGSRRFARASNLVRVHGIR